MNLALVGLPYSSRAQVIPGIIMAGTSSSFFKIPVTHELTQCVEYGTFPPTPTVVIGHVPVIPRPSEASIIDESSSNAMKLSRNLLFDQYL